MFSTYITIFIISGLIGIISGFVLLPILIAYIRGKDIFAKKKIKEVDLKTKLQIIVVLCCLAFVITELAILWSASDVMDHCTECVDNGYTCAEDIKIINNTICEEDTIQLDRKMKR